jgi:hypothetical protein
MLEVGVEGLSVLVGLRWNKSWIGWRVLLVAGPISWCD